MWPSWWHGLFCGYDCTIPCFNLIDILLSSDPHGGMGCFVVFDCTIPCFTLIDILLSYGPHGGMGCFVGMIVPYPVLI